MSYEAELLALAVLLYLYDSSVLLHSNEGVMTCTRGGRWSFNTGWVGFVLAGRSLCMLDPFAPHRPAFRLSWNFRTLAENGQGWTELASPMFGVGACSIVAALALFVILPAGLLTSLGAYAVVPAVFLLYGSILWALFRVHRTGILRTRNKRFLGFAFECLACPPFGVNMVRRITLADRVREPLPVAGARLLDEPQWSELRSRCLARLEEAGRLAADDGELADLESQKARLNALSRAR